ncbi:MAG: MBL fold metallo-hydrolase, partial [Cytophagales bacterium]|nr:MBL fold metallo-hydrolase [Cytophagales bacterium]
MVKAFAIDTGFFKLDGGAMFGVVPKSIWNRLNPSDENNMCTWSMRCLLLEYSDRLILIDTGIGNKQSEDFFKHFYLHGDGSLVSSIKNAGFSPKDITDVFFTHLHFDHCGGAVNYDSQGNPALTFPNANHWTHSKHLQSALEPNPREKPSFQPDNILPLVNSGKLKFVDEVPGFFDPYFHFLPVSGHTEHQLLPIIPYKNTSLVYAADLIPSVGHLAIPYVMAYDMQPLLAMKEKEHMLEKVLTEDWVLFFE